MAEYKIDKKHIPEFVAAVSTEYMLYGPKAENGVVAFRSVGCGEELMLDYRNSTISAKQLFLPRVETVYEFDGKNFVDDKLPDEKRVIFGMRPCDCRALVLLDLVYDTERIKDPFYVTRRRNTVVMALGCSRPLSTCFCTTVGGDPFGQEGQDILMADAGDALLTKALTAKGKDFLTQYSKFFSSAGSPDWDKHAREVRKIIKSGLDTEKLKGGLDDWFEAEIWETASLKCLGCGACSYLCPTCYCFDLVDEKTATSVRKLRRWDCCVFALFTLHASGYNPRPVNSARMRQKIMHKFSYYPQRYGLKGCVGCGRCIRSCPVNLDIRQLLEQIVQAPKAVAGK